MVEVKSMTVAEVRNLLVEKGLTVEEANSYGKAEAKAKLEELMSDDQILEDAETNTDVENVFESIPSLPSGGCFDLELDKKAPEEYYQLPDVLTPQSEGYTEWMLSNLRPDELKEGHPKADGLRRLVEAYIGPIYSIQTKVIQAPTLENNYHATVRSRVNAGMQVVDACADASSKNTPIMFAKHPVATAESRAEGRAYRKLLRLTSIICAEENVKDDEIFDMGDKITNAQLNLFDNISQKCDIDVLKWLESNGVKTKPEDITRNKAQELCATLNGLNSVRNNIPAEIKGYQSTWR